MILSDGERAKFADYLEESAVADERLAEQIEKLQQMSVAKRYRTEAMAARIIVAKLRATHSERIG